MHKTRKKLSVVCPCFNEEDNLRELFRRLILVSNELTDYEFEFIFIDNSSTDRTPNILRALSESDPRVKVIINLRNFGHIRSPYWAVMQASGDAIILMASDLQEPPELILEFVREWEYGYKIVLGRKPESDTNLIVHNLRRIYYLFLQKISEIELTRDANGFGLYDRDVIEQVKKINDPNPYLRGLVCELGYTIKTVDYAQAKRFAGITKNNFYTLYDIAMLGIVSHSLIPIRIASMLGFFISFLSIIFAIIYVGLKIFFWDKFLFGMAPLIIINFFMFGILFLFIGIIGEYIGSIHNYVKNRPIVVEKERINF